MERIYKSFLLEGKKNTIVVLQTRCEDESYKVYIAFFDKKEDAEYMQKWTGDMVHRYQDFEITTSEKSITIGSVSFHTSNLITEE